MNCRYCGELNPEDATFCKKCGKRLDGQAVCLSCGKVVPADGDFCIFCGARLSPENVAMPNNATAPAAPAILKVDELPMQDTKMNANKADRPAHIVETRPNMPRSLYLSTAGRAAAAAG